jgi:two-component system, OmpR family, sensor kinase
MPSHPLDLRLRQRVALVGGLSIVAVLLFGVAAIYIEEDFEHRHSLDAGLQQVGQAVLSLVEADPDFKSRAHLRSPAQRGLESAAAPQYFWQVWSRDGVLLLKNHQSFGSHPVVPLANSGLGGVNLAGNAYRVMSLHAHDDSLVVQVEVPDEGKWTGSGPLHYLQLSLPIAFGLVLGATWLMLWRTIRAVSRLADKLRNRHPLDATRLDDGSELQPVQPLAIALNQLFDRITQLTAVERGLRGAVAHEIRGSLASIRAQAQLARGAQAPGELDSALGLLMSGVDRASRMLDQVLDLARVDGMKRDSEPDFQCLQIPAIYQQVKDELGAKAEARRITLVSVFEAREVQGLPPAFYMLLRNLLENAILYVPPEGRIEVRTSLQMGDVVLTVDDSGRGIPVSDRELAFERFNRLGQRDTVGVGLGLWIVKRIVELHDARIRLRDSPLRGLRVEIVFPAAKDSRTFASPDKDFRAAA